MPTPVWQSSPNFHKTGRGLERERPPSLTFPSSLWEQHLSFFRACHDERCPGLRFSRLALERVISCPGQTRFLCRNRINSFPSRAAEERACQGQSAEQIAAYEKKRPATGNSVMLHVLYKCINNVCYSHPSFFGFHGEACARGEPNLACHLALKWCHF